ncbi:CYR1 [Candida jiufengensis]|uniref:CYR1 n=1 Tax=Candida jiufengensis TaxID=497108 RepID=UPI00222567BC|nr:CYR1 [Candida jiufengensis]KAI5950976.1 CYR1 [Candida jiufengensis]
MSQQIPIKAPVKQPEWHRPKDLSPPTKLKIYNSLTRTKNEFIPIKPGHITWYSCGPTVYDHSHMGHARNYVSTDISRRILQDYFGYNVKFIQNVTDIDDKIIIAARQQYLFDEHITKRYKEINDELKEKSNTFLKFYVSKNIPEFSGEIDEFINWSKTVNVEEIKIAKPKFPMYLNAATKAYEAITNENISFDHYLLGIKDIAVVSLDKEYGASVTDPEIFKKLPAYWENKYNEDMLKLNVLPPTFTTRVSEYIPDIIEYVEKIISNGYAYKTDDGSVYFDTIKYENSKHDYAKLQPWNKGDMSLINDGEGSLSSGTSKRNASDFALWKSSKPGEPSWPSIWGKGRPGWHIECSVMASDLTGSTMDIHSGGIDLCFPHHDNELAQSEAYFDNNQWVNYFMHNGHLHIEGQKMSKSLKNFITIEEALKEYTPNQLRLVFLLNPWEKPLDFKDSLITEVKTVESTFNKFFTIVHALQNENNNKVQNGEFVSKRVTDSEKQLYEQLENAQDQIDVAFKDNLSSGSAIKVLINLIGSANSYIQAANTGSIELKIEVLSQIANYITKILNILGLETKDNTKESSNDVDVAIKLLSQFRDKIRNFSINKADSNEYLKASDELRNQLINIGVSLDDRPDGSALIKYINETEKQQLIEQQETKLKQQKEKENRKKQLAEIEAKKEQEKLNKMKTPPSELFKNDKLYKEYDEQGIPTIDVNGEEISKSMKKKLMKQYQQQEKLHNEYLKKVGDEEIKM